MRATLPVGAVWCGDTALWIHGVDWYLDGWYADRYGSTARDPRAERPPRLAVALPHAVRVRRRPELVVHGRDLAASDVVDSPWGPVTSIERTSYDVARDPSLARSVPRLDALARATAGLAVAAWQSPGLAAPGRAPTDDTPRRGGIDVEAVLAIAAREPGARWVRRVPVALGHLDAGAESPRESELRLAMVLAGLPRPETQVEVFDARGFVARLDLGWRALRLALEYDGRHHDDPGQVARDRQRLNRITACGWRVLLVDRALFASPGRLIQEVQRLFALAEADAALRP